MAIWSPRAGRSHTVRVSRGTDLKGCVDGRVQGVVNRVLKHECAGVKVGVLASNALWMGVRIAGMQRGVNTTYIRGRTKGLDIPSIEV